jgi:hypothetical protein
MPRKTTDPRRIALEDKADRARADFERWYVRCKRAFTAMEKARQRLIRLQRQLAHLDPPAGLDLRAEAEAAAWSWRNDPC